jgi:hypothetical protein
LPTNLETHKNKIIRLEPEKEGDMEIVEVENCEEEPL